MDSILIWFNSSSTIKIIKEIYLALHFQCFHEQRKGEMYMVNKEEGNILSPFAMFCLHYVVKRDSFEGRNRKEGRLKFNFSDFHAQLSILK